MRILQLCKKFPYPLKDGESIAVTNLSKALNELGCEVTLLSMNTTKHYCDIEKLPADYNQYKEIHPVDLDNTVHFLDAALNLFSKESFHISRFISKEFESKLVDVLKSKTFDIVQLETPVLSDYIPIIRKNSGALVVMRSHNVEHEIWGRVAENEKFLPRKWYLKNATSKLKNFELEHLNNYDILLAISERDLETFKKLGLKKPGIVTPIGVNMDDYDLEVEEENKDLSISFIGSLDWVPNQEGLRWFLNHVWKNLNGNDNDLILHIAGRNTPEWISNLRMDGVKVYGEIPNARKFINQHQVMVVPLFSGSGMRVKILEGMALGKTVITTTIGLEGIGAKNGLEVLIADNPEEFIQAVSLCKNDPEKCRAIGQNAKAFIQGNYDRKVIAKNLVDTYSEIIERKAKVAQI